MYAIELTVPEAEHEQARRLGARWHEKYAVWYVLRTRDAVPLSRWLTARNSPNIRSNIVWLARASGACPYCEGLNVLYALMLPMNHEVLYPAEEAAGDSWEAAEEPTQLYQVGYLSEGLQAVLHTHAPSYHLGFSTVLMRFCWMNHCQHCDELIEDDECALAAGSPLNPLDAAAAAAITLKEFHIAFEASCGSFSCGVDLLEAMPRAHA